VLIIEDEPIIAMDIESIVRDLGHNVTAGGNSREAVSQARKSPPGLVWQYPACR
jgi:CheY-like chemotaxis protein